MDNQYHFKKHFYLDKKTGYWISTTTPHVRAHVWVWENNFGKRPRGYHVHHIDGNKSNNDISNLELKEISAHLRDHMTPERRLKAGENAKLHQHKTKEWHSSIEGLKWHSEHAKKTGFGRWIPQEFMCEVCEKIYSTSKRSGSRFCSNNCKSKYRRKKGLDNQSRICLVCDSLFLVNKYARRKYCTTQCRSEARRSGDKVDTQDEIKT